MTGINILKITKIIFGDVLIIYNFSTDAVCSSFTRDFSGQVKKKVSSVTQGWYPMGIGPPKARNTFFSSK